MENILFEEIVDVPFRDQGTCVYASNIFIEIQNAIQKHFDKSEISELEYTTHKVAQNKFRNFVTSGQLENKENIPSVFNFTVKGKDYFGINYYHSQLF